MSDAPTIMISAGEASGDRLGAGLALELKRQMPGLKLIGMGGREMRRAGVELVEDAAKVSVVGFLEVLSHLGDIRAAMAGMAAILEPPRPDLFVPIDFPDFNLKLAKRAVKSGVPVVYFVSPQIWAWRRGRVRLIRRLVRRMLVLFPFEEKFYRDASVPVTFVGHPVVDRVQETASEPEEKAVALLPGSRRGEVERLFPVMLQAAEILQKSRPDLQFMVPRAHTLPHEFVERFVANSSVGNIRVHSGEYPGILSGCAAGVVASGTATLEAAMAGLPMVVVYRMNRLSYALGRLLVRVEHVGMVNLVAGRRMVPELIQGECTAEAIAKALGGYLDDRNRRLRTRDELITLRSRLGGPGAFNRAARAILKELPESR